MVESIKAWIKKHPQRTTALVLAIITQLQGRIRPTAGTNEVL